MTGCAEHSPQPAELLCGQKQALGLKCSYYKEMRQQGGKQISLSR